MSENTATKLQKVYIEFDDPSGDGLMKYQTEVLEGSALTNVVLPFDLGTLPQDTNMYLYGDGMKQPEIIEGLADMAYFITGAGDNTQLREKKQKSRLLNGLDPEYFSTKSGTDTEFPKITVCDVTERDMFGDDSIASSSLKNENAGIWAWHGLRKLELKIDGLMEEEDASDLTVKASLYWNRIDNDDISPLFEEEIRYNKEHQVYTAYINTNRLGEALRHTDSQYPLFSGRFELHYVYLRHKQVYSFPLRICVHDTQLDGELENHLLDDSSVSIDFGTSSTCAAVKDVGGKKLFTLSGTEKIADSEINNRYENPTNLMIYNWDELYRQWQYANKNCPFVVTRNNQRNEKESDYDSGYTVEKIYRDVDDPQGRRKMEAILSELKMIPYLLKNKKEIRFSPFNDRNRSVIKVTDRCDQENDNLFNPIAFYGYLLSRAINNPVRGRMYREYNITYPVKFTDYKDILKESLEAGIKRALPRPLQEAKDEEGNPFIKVNMKYEESVACVGAVVGSQLPINDESPEAKIFAIFDLGGGTLDTAYGIFRPAKDDELDWAEQTIQIFGVGGNYRAGGERLIHQLAYKIYLDNKEDMNAKKIKFVLPLGEKEPPGVDASLFSSQGDQIAEANLTLMKEQLARYLFEHDGQVDDRLNEILSDAPNGEEYRLTLRDKDNADIELTLKVKGIDDFLTEKFSEIIDGFEKEMKGIFEVDPVNRKSMEDAGISYSLDKLHIFLGGNASKQHYLRDAMEKRFPNIERIGDGQEDANKSEVYQLNGKTAVAFGQLELGEYYIDRSAYETGKAEEDEEGIAAAKTSPFNYYLGYIDSGSKKFKPIIKPNDNRREWTQANLLNNANGKTNLRYTSDPNMDQDTLMPLEVKVKRPAEKNKRMLWVRVNPDASNSIEYRVSGRNDAPDANELPNPDMTIELIGQDIRKP